MRFRVIIKQLKRGARLLANEMKGATYKGLITMCAQTKTNWINRKVATETNKTCMSPKRPKPIELQIPILLFSCGFKEKKRGYPGCLVFSARKLFCNSNATEKQTQNPSNPLCCRHSSPRVDVYLLRALFGPLFHFDNPCFVRRESLRGNSISASCATINVKRKRQ